MKNLRYRNGRLAIQMRGQVISVNLPDEPCGENETFLDTNNFPNAVDKLNKAKIAFEVVGTGRSGYCEYPKIKLL